MRSQTRITFTHATQFQPVITMSVTSKINKTASDLPPRSRQKTNSIEKQDEAQVWMNISVSVHDMPANTNKYFLMGHPRPLFVYFCPVKQTLQFLQKRYVKKSPSSIQCWDSNPCTQYMSLLSLPLDQGSHPMLTNILPYIEPIGFGGNVLLSPTPT